MLNQYMINSIQGFKVSQHCDRTNVDTFIESYIKRKEKIIEGKLNVFNKTPERVNETKLAYEIKILQEFRDNLPEVKDYLKETIFDQTSWKKQNAIKEINAYIKKWRK